jgi:penicillin-binding protein 2
MIAQEQSLLKKILTIAGIVAALIMVIIARLSYLQINLTEDFVTRSQNNFLRYEQKSSLRGNIIDHMGKLLATNRPVINIYWKGTGNKKFSEEQTQQLSDLKTMLGPITTTDTEINRAEWKAQKLLLAKDVDFDQLSKISERFASSPTVLIETDFTRLYPYKKMASHVLGYLGNLNVGWAGKMGLEKLYETSLKGQNGMTQKILNSFGKHLSEKEVEQSLAGKDITITLDLSLQRIAEMLFPRDKKGVFILMDSTDGSLRVALSRPDFDPNLFMGTLDQEMWQEIKDKKPFLNRTYNACYPPGSIFKLVTLAAALESGIIEEDTLWECKGSVIVGKRKFRCHRQDGHGFLTATEAVAKSCNILFYDIARTLDIDVLANYARRFGLGKSVGSVFNDSPGLIPTREWKARTKGERWWLGETLSANIGQSYLLTTPIQIARMIAGIEVGYLVAPRILEESSVTYEPLNLKYETRTFLQKTMRAVAVDGTARTLNKLEDFEIFAKTSTAQTSMLGKRHLGEQFKEHGWFTANFKYKGGPPMTMVILTENAGNARLALMIGKAFLKSYKDLIELREKRHKKS